MNTTNTLIIGGGQAGLAMSRCLSERGIENVILERGRIGERWRSERWESLRLLTPNWQSRLPGWSYQGSDPDGYMTRNQVIRYLEGYASAFDAPVEEGTTVQKVEAIGSRFYATTDRGVWRSDHVVIATGYCAVPYVPDWAKALSDEILSVTPSEYRNPSQLPRQGVLVVGASATGIQLADEIYEAGLPVTLAVSHHIRLPRRYRGQDILWWLDEMGILDQAANEVYDFEISRDQPSLQLVGRPDHASLDLPILQQKGVRLTGRLLGFENESQARFDDNLVAYTVAADVKLTLLLKRIDEFIEESGMENEVQERDAPEPFFWPLPAPTKIDLEEEKIGTVLWATGFKRNYSWLQVPVLDSQGEIIHREGVTPHPGLYVLGMQFQSHRNSSFIDGVGEDARALASQIAGKPEIAERCIA